MKIVTEGTDEKGRYTGPVKLVSKRDYSDGSISEHIRRATTVEELEEIRKAVLQLMREGRLSRRALRKIDAAGKAKGQQLSLQLIKQVPARVLVPRGGRQEKRSPGGIILP